jgi:hypothetical protein
MIPLRIIPVPDLRNMAPDARPEQPQEKYSRKNKSHNHLEIINEEKRRGGKNLTLRAASG